MTREGSERDASESRFVESAPGFEFRYEPDGDRVDDRGYLRVDESGAAPRTGTVVVRYRGPRS